MLARLALFALAFVFSLFTGLGAGCAGLNPPSATGTPIIVTQAPTLSPSPIATSASSQIPTETSPPSPQPTSTAVPAGTPTPSASSSPPATAAAPTTSAAVAPPTPVQQSFSGTEADKFDVALASTIGSRPEGSPASQRAAEYISAQFAGMGYQVSMQPYPVTSFEEKSTSLSVTRPKLLAPAASALTYSAAGDVGGDLVYCGLGRQAEFPPAGIQGKIALLDRGEVTFQAKVDAATASGAVGVVIANNQIGDIHGSLSQPAKIPVVGVSQADGRSLRSLVDRGQTTVKLTVDASITSRQGQNAIAVKPDTEPGRKKIVIGAHYDSVPAGPGANDNGSGVATILELARETRDRTFPFDLVFVAFGDEEIGLVGSRAYVQSLSPEDRSRTQAMLNFDMVGVGTAMEFGGDKALAADITAIAQSLGVKTEPSSLLPGQTSDHASFLSAGIPAIFFYRADDPNYHTSRDTIDKVAPENLGIAGELAVRLLDVLARRT